MERSLRLIAANPGRRACRTIEAVLVVASQPLTADEARRGDRDDREARRRGARAPVRALSRGRSGIVLEHVAGGWAYRASREAAGACARLFDRPVERGLSQAALETLGDDRVPRPLLATEIARIAA